MAHSDHTDPHSNLAWGLTTAIREMRRGDEGREREMCLFRLYSLIVEVKDKMEKKYIFLEFIVLISLLILDCVVYITRIRLFLLKFQRRVSLFTTCTLQQCRSTTAQRTSEGIKKERVSVGTASLADLKPWQ